MHKFIIPALFISSLLGAQQPFCHTTEMQQAWFSANPALREKFERLQQEAAEFDREMFRYGYNQSQTQMKGAAASSYTIPVVFHILHVGGQENISDAQVIDAVRILNEDFNVENPDTADVVPQFKNNIGNPGVRFALATKDPNGNCTNGIVRHYDENTDWGYSFSNYKYSWPSNRYLNIYVVRKIGSGTAGYTYLPGSGIPPSADAIVILATYVGSIGTGHKGTSRALTHEVGHWFNLPHTWGGTNQPGVKCGDDGVSDTPETQGFTSCNLNNATVCNPGVVENMQNYMDYAYCQRMFTTGQAFRMQAALNSNISGRSTLWSPSNLALTGVTNPVTGCAPKLDIAVEGFTICAGKQLTAISFTSVGEPTTYAWNASNGASVHTTGGTKTGITFLNPGTTTITCVASNNAGSATATAVVDVRAPWSDIGGTYSESFEFSAPELPLHWSKQNSTPLGWQTTSISASDGLTSMYVRADLLPANAVAILETPSYDFLNNPGAFFTFKYAYRKFNSANKDIFILQASADCGGTWRDVYAPSAHQLAAGSGGVSSELFVPAPEHWNLYDQLHKHPMFLSFLTEPNVRFRFYFKEDVDGKGYGNRLFVDEINFAEPVGVNELTRYFNFNVYPNPANGQFNINFTLSEPSKVKYKLITLAGSEITASAPVTYGPGEHSVAVNEQRQLAPGIYFLNVAINGAIMSKKIVVQ